MSFQCPDCSKAESLKITSTLQLPPDSRSDEIILQVLKCSSCDFAGIALYEESRRGAMDDDSYDHTGYRMDPAELDLLEGLIRKCRRPKKPRCGCEIHVGLGEKDASGRIAIAARYRANGTFPMRRA